MGRCVVSAKCSHSRQRGTLSSHARCTAASFVKIEPGLWEGSHDFCCVLTPPASRFLDVGHWDRTSYKFILIEWRGGRSSSWRYCLQKRMQHLLRACIYSLHGRSVSRVIHMQAGTGQKPGEVVKSSATVCNDSPVTLLLLVNPRCVGEIGIPKIGTICYASPASRHSSDPAERYRESLGEKRRKRHSRPQVLAQRTQPQGTGGQEDQMVRDQGIQMARAGRRLVRQ